MPEQIIIAERGIPLDGYRRALRFIVPYWSRLVFVMLVATGQANVYLIRERGHFWQSRPSTWLVASSIADLVVVSAMATEGVLMAPVNPLLIAELMGAVATYLLMLDQLKVVILRRLNVR